MEHGEMNEQTFVLRKHSKLRTYFLQSSIYYSFQMKEESHFFMEVRQKYNIIDFNSYLF